MKCQKVQELIVAYLDDEVTPSERALVDAHLNECKRCRSELASFSMTQNFTRHALAARTAEAVPSPQAWNRLQARLAEEARPLPSKVPAWLRRLAPGVGRNTNSVWPRGEPMKKRFAVAAVATCAVLLVAALIIPNAISPVSAQAVMERSAATQDCSAADQGICHTKSESFFDYKAFSLDVDFAWGTPEHTIEESHADLQTGNQRSIVFDADSGQMLSAFGQDEEYFYSGWSETDRVFTIYRSPIAQDSTQVQGGSEFALNSEDLFDQARQDPSVEYVGQETWHDGRKVHVLRFTPEYQLVFEDGEQTITLPVRFISTMYFDAETYQLVETSEAIERDGEEILVSYHRTLVREVLPSNTAIAWDMSDLPNVTIVDDSQRDSGEIFMTGTASSVPELEIVSLEEMVDQADFRPYVLSAVPEGYTMEIRAFDLDGGMLDEQGETQTPCDRAFSIAYYNDSDEFLDLSESGRAPFADVANGAEQTYETASGIKLHFQPQDNAKEGVIRVHIEEDGSGPVAISMAPRRDGEFASLVFATVETPDGFVFELMSNLPIEEIKALAELLVPAR
jgi:hypothetical protein